MSLITKYRPTSFEELLGNKETVASIKALLDKEDPKRTFLISGLKGTGKTTIGHVIAQYVGCNMSLDFIEVDAAALNGAPPARELRENCKYGSITQGPRVWLIDECHRMTDAAQEILLKTFEKPPEHAFFILATTEPNRLKDTFIDRMAHFTMKPLSENEFKLLIKKVTRKEGFPSLAENIITSLYDKAEGRPRTGLNILEKVLTVTDENMMSMISAGIDIEGAIIDLCRCIIKKESWVYISKLLLSLLEKEPPEEIRRGIYGYMVSIISKGENPYAFEVASNFKETTYINGKNDLIYACYNACH